MWGVIFMCIFFMCVERNSTMTAMDIVYACCMVSAAESLPSRTKQILSCMNLQCIYHMMHDQSNCESHK